MVDILVKAIEIKDGKPVDVMEGNVPKEQADNCQVGETLDSIREALDGQVSGQKLKITKREELKTEIGIDYVRLEVERYPQVS
jgi:hypothetical protein